MSRVCYARIALAFLLLTKGSGTPVTYGDHVQNATHEFPPSAGTFILHDIYTRGTLYALEADVTATTGPIIFQVWERLDSCGQEFKLKKEWEVTPKESGKRKFELTNCQRVDESHFLAIRIPNIEAWPVKGAPRNFSVWAQTDGETYRAGPTKLFRGSQQFFWYSLVFSVYKGPRDDNGSWCPTIKDVTREAPNYPYMETTGNTSKGAANDITTTATSYSISTAVTTVPTVTPDPTTATTTVPTVTPDPTTAATTVPTVTPDPATAATTVPTVTPDPATAATTVPTMTPDPATAATTVPTVTPDPATAATNVPTVTPDPTGSAATSTDAPSSLTLVLAVGFSISLSVVLAIAVTSAVRRCQSGAPTKGSYEETINPAYDLIRRGSVISVTDTCYEEINIPDSPDGASGRPTSVY